MSEEGVCVAISCYDSIMKFAKHFRNGGIMSFMNLIFIYVLFTPPCDKTCIKLFFKGFCVSKFCMCDQ